jgi:predicted nucleic acid-binding protein
MGVVVVAAISIDAQIAAICRTYNAALATRNLKDFRHTGVDLINPWQGA